MKRLTAALRGASAGHPLFVAVDQEGGKVARFQPGDGFPAYPSAAELGRGTPDATRRTALGLGRMLRELGVNLNFAPVLDVNVYPLSLIHILLLAALLHASWNAVIKGGSNKLYETGLNCFGGGVGVLFIVPFLPFPALESLKFLAGSCTVHIAYYLCIAVAYRNVDMSFAYTIMRGTAPLLTSVFMLLSGHEMPLAGWLGILCLCAGVLTLTLSLIHI